MKKYVYSLIIFLFLLFPIMSYAIVKPTSSFYVNDYADLLSSETEKYILEKSVALHNTDGTQIVVVTVSNLEGMSIEEYAYKLFNSFGIGDDDKNNGLLLLLALEEREFRVEVGDGLGGILPDGKTGRFQDDYIIPYLSEDEWDEGIINGYDAFYSEIVKLNNLDIEYNEPINVEDNSEDVIHSAVFMLSTFVGMMGGFLARSFSSKTRVVFAYLSLWFIATLIVFFNYTGYILYCLTNLFCFFVVSFGNGNVYIGYGSSFGGSSRGRSSGFSGGGGRSSGGGSSRRF